MDGEAHVKMINSASYPPLYTGADMLTKATIGFDQKDGQDSVCNENNRTSPLVPDQAEPSNAGKTSWRRI